MNISQKEFTGFWLQSARLRKMLENARRLIDLIDDGKEKITGDFIFDQRYNFSLVERMVETSGDMVFEASILAPNGIENLYHMHDECRTFAENAFKKFRHSSDAESDSIEDMPEFKLLSEILDWVEGTGSESSVMDLLKSTFDHVFSRLSAQSPASGLDRNPSLSIHSSLFHLVDLGGGLSATSDQQEVAIDKVSCRPLQLLAQMAPGDSENNTQKRHANALAVVSDVNLHLQSLLNDDPFFLETSLMGHEDSDFVFMYKKDDKSILHGLSEKFRIEQTPNGWMAWVYGKSPEHLAKEIGQLGQFLF